MSWVGRGLIISIIFILGLAACGTADPAPVDVVEPVTEVQEAAVEEASGEVAEAEVEADAVQPAEAIEAPEDATVFQLVEGETEARFIINEVLRGEPTTVIGRTDAVSGEIFINLVTPAASEVGLVSVEAGTLKTDNNFRNGAIRDFILQTGEYPQITFSPISIVGIPSNVAVGDAFTFELTGDLTIRDITQPVTFVVDVTAESESIIRGSASATVLRQDYDLTIPSVPQVASVEPQVILELEFAASR
jgi:polyisoprenoid-binding protein YceI